MRKLAVFNNVSLDGYIADARGDMRWAHNDDAEWTAFAAENASGGGVLLLGRITYDLMASYWPTPAARATAPAVAEGMNRMQKVVCSRTLDQATWQNTTLVKDDIVAAVRKMKDEPGPGIAILGSGSIVAQLTEARLIDEYQIVVHPVVLGDGKTMFAGLRVQVPLRLTKTRVFGNGNVVLWYEPSQFSAA
jgi:dihydrofolate reductase